MSFDPEALRRLGGPALRPSRPAPLGYLVRVGAGAGVAAAVCDVALLLTARAAGWQTAVDGVAVQPLAVILVCVLVGVLAGIGAYLAARVTSRPPIWVAVAGIGLYLASLPGLPTAIAALHTVAALWIVGWLAVAVKGGSHLRH